MYTPEQIDTMLQQNQKLLEQNQQLIGMLAHNQLPAHPLKRRKKTGKKEVMATQITCWYYASLKHIPPHIASKLKAKIKNKGLWQD